MRRHFVSGFPRALLSLSLEKSYGVEIAVKPIRSLSSLSSNKMVVTICIVDITWATIVPLSISKGSGTKWSPIRSSCNHTIDNKIRGSPICLSGV